MSTILLGGAVAVASIVLYAILSTVFVGQEVAKKNDPVEFRTDTPGYFISAEDRKRYEEISYRWVNFSQVMSVEDCKEVKGEMCFSNVNYHACCKSRSKIISPTKVEDINGNEQQLVPGQFFPTETCVHIKNCNKECTCTLVDDMFHGKTTGNEWIWFLLPACCKCLN